MGEKKDERGAREERSRLNPAPARARAAAPVFPALPALPPGLSAFPAHPPPGPAAGRQVERTHIPRPRDGDTHSKYGFVHFRERAAAMRAVEDVEKPELDGGLLNVRQRSTRPALCTGGLCPRSGPTLGGLTASQQRRLLGR